MNHTMQTIIGAAPALTSDQRNYTLLYLRATYASLSFHIGHLVCEMKAFYYAAVAFSAHQTVLERALAIDKRVDCDKTK